MSTPSDSGSLRNNHLLGRFEAFIRRLLYVGSITIRHPRFRQAPITTASRLLFWSFQTKLLGNTPRRVPYVAGTSITVPQRTWQMYVFREDLHAAPELEWLLGQLRPGMVVIDVGAHLGTWTVAAAPRVAPSGHVIAFEPSQEASAYLAQSIIDNGLQQVTLAKFAIADRPGPVRLWHNGDSSMNSLGQNGDVFEEVDATTLDEFFASSSGLNRYDFLKVDVEGAEELVFRGAVETLTGYRPIIIFECNPGAAERMGLSADGAWQFLQSLGYDMSILVSGGTRRETLGFTKPPTARNAWNAIAVHPESKAYAR